jgi:hypothetical protein
MLFVIPPVVIYAAIFSVLFQGTSDYITFIFAAFLVVDTALIGVPAFLGANDTTLALAKLSYCSRADLALQFMLPLVLALFATSAAFKATNAWVFILFLGTTAAAAVALIARYLVIGLWLAFKAVRSQWSKVAVTWLLFLVSPTVLYGSASWFLLPGLLKPALFFFVTLSSAQSIVFGVPGFEPLSPERRRIVRDAGLRLTITDLIVQSLLSVPAGVVLHIATAAPTAQSVLRFGVCAGLAIVGRYACVRGWMMFAGRRP